MCNLNQFLFQLFGYTQCYLFHYISFFISLRIRLVLAILYLAKPDKVKPFALATFLNFTISGSVNSGTCLNSYTTYRTHQPLADKAGLRLEEDV